MKTKAYLNFLKWAAQGIGFLTTAGLTIYLFSDVIPGMSHGRANAFVPILPLIFLGVSGFIISFYRELAGSTMMLAGGTSTVLYVLLAIQNQTAAMILGAPLALAGALYLWHWSLQFGMHHRHNGAKH